MLLLTLVACIFRYMELATLHVRHAFLRSIGADPEKKGGGVGIVGWEWWCQCTEVHQDLCCEFLKEIPAVHP